MGRVPLTARGLQQPAVHWPEPYAVRQRPGEGAGPALVWPIDELNEVKSLVLGVPFLVSADMPASHA